MPSLNLDQYLNAAYTVCYVIYLELDFVCTCTPVSFVY